MRVVTLVPWRPGDGFRQSHWDFVRPHLERLGYDLFTGDAPGPWARARACNAAAKAAGDWDVALVADADSILEQEAVQRTIERVTKTKAAARPHDRRYMLSLGASKLAMMRGVEGVPEKFLRWTSPGGGALVIHREAFDAVGGYDERFVGWGYEDSAMNINLAIGRGWEIVPGRSWHLFHAPGNIHTPAARANLELLEEMRMKHAPQIARASRRAGVEDLNAFL